MRPLVPHHTHYAGHPLCSGTHSPDTALANLPHSPWAQRGGSPSLVGSAISVRRRQGLGLFASVHEVGAAEEAAVTEAPRMPGAAIAGFAPGALYFAPQLDAVQTINCELFLRVRVK